MTNRWSFICTPEFFVGTLVAGLLLDVTGAYIVRTLDRVGVRLTGSFRRVRGEEAARTEQLAAAATSDNALWAALAAEASRLRLLQLLRFLTSFVFIGVFLLADARGELMPGSSHILLRLTVVGFVVFAFIQYIRGLDLGKLARRLDVALATAHRNRNLPIMD